MTRRIAALAATTVGLAVALLLRSMVDVLSGPFRTSAGKVLESISVQFFEPQSIDLVAVTEPVHYLLFALAVLAICRVAQFGLQPVGFLAVTGLAVTILLAQLGASFPVLELGLVVVVLILLAVGMALARLAAIVTAFFLAGTSATMFFVSFDRAPWQDSVSFFESPTSAYIVFAAAMSLLQIAAVAVLRD